MNIKKFAKYIEKNYYNDDQKLLLEGWVDEKAQRESHCYFSQEVYYKDFGLCDIQTWDCVNEERIAHTPYCERMTFWDGYIITVPKFGELTDEDIAKAIGYVLKCIEEESNSFFSIYNVYFDKVHIDWNRTKNYTLDSEMLRDQKKRLPLTNIVSIKMKETDE